MIRLAEDTEDGRCYRSNDVLADINAAIEDKVCGDLFSHAVQEQGIVTALAHAHSSDTCFVHLRLRQKIVQAFAHVIFDLIRSES